MKIKVLGSGCANCHKLHEEAKKAVESIRKDIKVEYITDISAVLSYGVMTVPALVVDEKVVSQGRVLKASDIEKMINGMEIDDSCDGESCGCSCQL